MCNRFENMSKQIRAQCPTKLTRRVAVETVRQLFQLLFFFGIDWLVILYLNKPSRIGNKRIILVRFVETLFKVYIRRVLYKIIILIMHKIFQ